MSARLRSHCRILVLLFNLATLQLASTLSDVVNMSPIISASSSSLIGPATRAATSTPKIITIREKIWRTAASKHSHRIKSLLQPGLISPDHPRNYGRQKRGNQQRGGAGRFVDDGWTALDPINPIYNFLIEYYGLKGAKGPRRLGRWAPDPKILLETDSDDDNDGHAIHTPSSCLADDAIYRAAMKASHGLGGILLENANLDDLGGTLYLRGSVPVPVEEEDPLIIQQSTPSTSSSLPSANDDDIDPELHGILYNPAVFYNRHIPIGDEHGNDSDIERRKKLLKTIAPFQWYSSILQTTLDSDPILHCYGLHEWAMQYHPEGANPPPSARYQSNLKLRVPREVINDTVERKGIRCTHVDALRFFAPAAGPLNHHGADLERTDQLRLEQRGCVHAHMDLLKIGLKLQGFINAELMGDILEIALAARKLDVEASPYDVTAFGAGIVAVETNEGRRMYKEQQAVLMQRAEPVRERLLSAYDAFLKLSFDEGLLGGGYSNNDEGVNDTVSAPYVAPERLARAQPGGLPWRKNLIE
ncbi:hypothetical protein ACHAXR_008201 [Thalassiosira sp. AJA248-18]